MTVFNRDLHDAAEVGAYVGVRLIPRCRHCGESNAKDLAYCEVCEWPQERGETRLVQGRLTDGTLKWFHLARYALLVAGWLNKLADWLEEKDGR